MTAFNQEKYIKLQSEKIIERVNMYGNKLYLEFGGKIFQDLHASRVLPGFKKDSKIMMLTSLKDKMEVVIAICAKDIQNNKMRNDLHNTYQNEVLQLIESFEKIGLKLGSVVITQYIDVSSVNRFQIKLERMGIKVYRHYPIEGYPVEVDYIISEEGYGKNEYIETTKPLVVVTAPGPGSGKMAVCLSQLYQENRRGQKAGYAKFETFPVWNLPLKHPVNLAYEAATSDLRDVNMVDPFHLEAYEKTAINYNRDVEVFPVLREMFKRIYGESPYKSPTDMGCNMVGFCIDDEKEVDRACKREIIRRYLIALVDYKNGVVTKETVDKNFLIMNEVGVQLEARVCVKAALEKSKLEDGVPAVAIELKDGTIVTGKQTKNLTAAAAALINAIKKLSGIRKRLKLISPNIIRPVQNMKTEFLGGRTGRLNSSEVLMALAVSKATNSIIEDAIPNLSELSGAEAHSTVILSYDDEKIFRRLNIRTTTEPVLYRHVIKK